MDGPQTLYTSGRFLNDRNGNQIVLRGVNLSLLDNWSFPGNDWLDEIAQTGANAVRIQWYVNYPNPRPPFSIADLDGVLQRCATAGMIPIVMVADLTCASDPSQVNSQLIPWWTSDDAVAVLSKNAAYTIVNIANEVGIYRWANRPKKALRAYAEAYTTAIASIRATGLSIPLMIDAPDCGTSLDAFLSVGQHLIDSDPDQNVLLSAHAYWAAYDGMPFIEQCIDAQLPVVFGEIANKQDDQINGEMVYCYYDLDGSNVNPGQTNGFAYQALLSTLQENDIGWLAWSWGPDWCSERQLSADRSFGALTPYGQDIVYNEQYGLIVTAQRVNLL